jgi:hypothetical protein
VGRERRKGRRLGVSPRHVVSWDSLSLLHTREHPVGGGRAVLIHTENVPRTGHILLEPKFSQW